MNNQTRVTHYIQKHILDVLVHQRTARFRDMRPLKVDTNLYSYHLSQLVKAGMVIKVDGGYTLGVSGFVYAEEGRIAQSSSATLLCVIQNSDGDILLQRRTTQPYIDTWTLPGGILQAEDLSIVAGAQRAVEEALGLSHQPLKHAGDCYIRVFHGGDTLSRTLAHVFTFNRDNITTTDTIQWARPHKLAQYTMAPAVDKIIARTFFHDPFYFEEFEENW